MTRAGISRRTLFKRCRQRSKEEALTSLALLPVFRGRSANMPSFVMAILRNEQAVLPYRRTARRHVLGDLDAFLAQADTTATQGKARPKRKTKASPRSKSEAPSANAS